MEHSAGQRQDGTEVRVAAATEADDFPANTVFLGGKLQSSKSGIEQVIRRGGSMVQWEVAHEETDVAQEEGMSRWGIASVFARSKQEEKGEARHVGAGKIEGRAGEDGNLHGVTEDGDWNWLHSLWRAVGASVPGEHPLESKIDSTLRRESGVRGPHTRQRLTNGA